MSLPYFEPIGREETYLAKIAGYDVTLPPHPISREEHYLAKIAGEDVELPVAPISRDEHYLAKTAGQDVELPPYPISRDEFYLAKMAGEDVPLPPNPTSRIGELLDEIAEQEPTPVVTLKTFDEATEEELVAMVQAADDGLIDLYDDAGWRVGQEREVSLSAIAASGTYDGVSWSVGEAQSAQTITLVLMHKGLYELVTPVKNKDGTNRSTCSFIVGVKGCLGTDGYMNSTNTNTGSWNASARRGWCNGGFRSALPENIRNCFKQFSCITGDYNGGSSTGGTNIITSDYFALAATKEVQNKINYSTSNEADALTQFTWYETANNRKKGKDNWGRSPSYKFNTTFCGTWSDGTSFDQRASNSLGISPFGCV